MNKVHSGLPKMDLVYTVVSTVNYFNTSFHSQYWPALDNTFHGYPRFENFEGSPEEINGNN